jgi:hypothetical protein
MRHNQMMLGIHGDLHVVADDAGTTPARGHRTTVGIGQLRQFLGKPRHLRGQCLRRLLPVGRVKLAQIARDALLQLGTTPFYFRPREVLVPTASLRSLLLICILKAAFACLASMLVADESDSQSLRKSCFAETIGELGEVLLSAK